ncbi:MAG: AraC family transcriptional regulator [Clostridium sp.]
MNYKSLRETSIHGSAMFPLHIYSNKDINGDFSVPYHWHKEIEILYIEKGEFSIKINDHNFIAMPGDLYFINSEELHQVSALNSNPSVHYAIVFTPELISFDFYDYCQSYYINPILNKTLQFPTTISINTSASSQITNEFMSAVSSYDNENLGWHLNVKSSLLKIISILIENDLLLKEGTLVNNSYKITIAKNLISYISNNYTHKITINDLANETNMNPQYFCRFFKSLFGKTAIEYINEYRIEKAAEMIKCKDIKIIEICFAVGFDNFSYFIKKFKEYKKCTPSKYKSLK